MKNHILKSIGLAVIFTLLPRTAQPACTPPANLIGWWPGESNANDIVGANNGTLVGGVGFVAGKVGQAFSFNGSNSYVSIPDSPSLHVFTTNITIELWLKSNELDVNPHWEGIVTKGNSSSSWRLAAAEGRKTVYFHSGIGAQDVYGSRNVNDGQWHHVAAVYDGAQVLLYVDGTLDASNPATGTISPNSQPVCLGQNSESTFMLFNGLEDEVSIYNRALTPSEIQSIYNAGSGGKCGLITIVLQPTNQTVTLGNTATFTVMATGGPPLSYQWRFYGTNISGATNSILSLNDVQLTNAGVYSVVVGNGEGGFLTSSNAVLQVLPLNAPSIQVNGVPAVGTITAIDSALVTMSGGFVNGFIFYTLDGSEPSFSSTLYTGAFTLTNSAPIRAMSLSEDFLDAAFAPAVQVQIKTLYNLLTSVVGSGTVSADPPSGPYISDSVVTLTAAPASNWMFDHWTGDATGSQNPLSLTMNGPKNVQAVFIPVPFYNLQTSVIGAGTIATNPPSGPYISNSIVTLTATAAQYWAFDHWTGDATGSINPTTVTMNGPRSVQAVFVQTAYPLTVSTPGGGSVTANGQVISPATYYPIGSVVSLAATAESGWSFLGWQGDASGANNPLSVTMNQTNNIQADFGTAVAMNPVGGGRIVLSQANPVPYGTKLTVSAVPDTGKYFVVWSSAISGTNTPAQIDVTNANPRINALFGTLPGGKYSMSVVVLGYGSVAINPQKNFYNAGDSVTLTASTTNTGVNFYGWTGDASGTNSSIVVVMNSNKVINANFAALPTVDISPQEQIVYGGSNAVLTANAAGLPPFTYQWQNSHGNIGGETNVTYTISNAQATNSGTYTVVVSNPFGSVTSAVATVTVVFPPSITLQPTNQTLAAGTSLTLSVLADGTAPLAYEWLDSFGAIPGETNSSLILNPALTNYTGNYSVIVSNAYGVVTSQVATVFVYIPVSILSQPASLVVSNLAPASFGVIASGLPDPTAYQWTFNGTNLVGATNNTFNISHVRLSNTGYYQVLVSNGYSSTNSYIATLNMSPSITSPFIGATTIWGRSATLSVGAMGSGELSYQWYLDGVAIDGATGATLNFPSIQFTNGGMYSVVVTSPFGNVTNVAAQVTVSPAGLELGFCPALTISGVVGYSYIIQSSTDLTDTNAWVTRTNLTLTEPVEIWVDTAANAWSPYNPKYFYRVLPGQ
jgi:hypothetical protein